ncbi:MAG: phosphate acyltransferase PlsX [Clostridia bacterium]|nr:phosphate acyltransferase PlsX [Clostridia bacterium]
MKIIVDAYGGDNAPQEIVKGAVNAVKENEGFNVVLVGKIEEIEALIKENEYSGDRIEIIDARDVITNDDVPTEAIRRKKDSSLVCAFRALNTDPDAVALISAGSSGAVLTGGMLLVKRIKGVVRAALAPMLPTVTGGFVVLCDCGANADCKPHQLVQFAHFGRAMAIAYMGIQNPRIGLLSNGTEDKKGNELSTQAFALLKEEKGLNFLGTMEAREMLSGDYDVIVADGFSGNIALKGCEGTALSFMTILKNAIMAGGLRAKIGYLLMKPVFKVVKKTLDYNDHGGAVLVGLQKIVIKSHGSSKAKSISASIMQAVTLHNRGIIDEVTKALTIDTPTETIEA